MITSIAELVAQQKICTGLSVLTVKDRQDMEQSRTVEPSSRVPATPTTTLDWEAVRCQQCTIVTNRFVMTQRMCQGAEITTVIVESVTSSSLESGSNENIYQSYEIRPTNSPFDLE